MYCKWKNNICIIKKNANKKKKKKHDKTDGLSAAPELVSFVLEVDGSQSLHSL